MIILRMLPGDRYQVADLFICQSCRYCCESRADMQQHMREAHGEEPGDDL